MNSFSEVGLGFAEFVSQLLNETFDSVLTAQNYQLEKYVELENARNLSQERFFALYLDNSVLLERALDIFGLPIKVKMAVESTVLAAMEDIFEDTTNMINKGQLTQDGYLAIQAFLLENVVNERKSMLDALLNKMEAARLVIDSGEIRAKLEFSNLHEATTTTDTGRKSRARQPQNIPGRIKNIDIKEYIDPTTKQKTLIVDKTTIPDGIDVKTIIPDVRVIARPVKMTTNSNLFSEVVIKFKTV